MPEVPGADMDFFVAFLRGLSKNELDYINDMCDGVDLHDIAER